MFDFVVCNGLCPGVVEGPAGLFFGGSKKLETYFQPVTGHGINFHKNATGAYKVMTNFLKQGGL
jgi:hypothetical protein